MRMRGDFMSCQACLVDSFLFLPVCK
jgi:hypothetical protein